MLQWQDSGGRRDRAHLLSLQPASAVADLGYDPESHALLARTLGALLRPRARRAAPATRPRALLAEEVRWRDVHGWLRDALRAEGLVVERADALGGRAVLLTVRAGDADSE